jgi:hypothetical protein
MESDSRSLSEAVFGDEIALIELGSDTSEAILFYRVVNTSWNHSVAYPWKEPIPDAMTRPEAEFHALIEGLRAVKGDYSRVIVFTNSEPILNQVQRQHPTPEELQPLHDRATRLVENFEWAVAIPYRVQLTRTLC